MARQSTLGLFNLALQLAHGALVFRNVRVGLALVLLDEVVNDTVVKVFTTEMGVTGGSENLENALLDREERDIKGTTSQVVDDDLRLFASLVKTVGYTSARCFHKTSEWL